MCIVCSTIVEVISAIPYETLSIGVLILLLNCIGIINFLRTICLDNNEVNFPFLL